MKFEDSSRENAASYTLIEWSFRNDVSPLCSPSLPPYPKTRRIVAPPHRGVDQFHGTKDLFWEFPQHHGTGRRDSIFTKNAGKISAINMVLMMTSEKHFYLDKFK